MRVDDHGGGFAVGLFCGIAVGAAIGMLFAPSQGKELRRQLSDRADRLRRETVDRYNEAANAVNTVVGRGRDAVAGARDAYHRARVDLEAGIPPREVS